MKESIYKSAAAKQEIMKLYNARLKACNIEFEDIYVSTFAGETHVVATGSALLPSLVVLHGINAGAPMALEAIKELNKTYRIYGIDTVGQATKSSETRLPLEGNGYGKWIAETMDKLGVEKAPVIGISYGGFLLQKLITFYPAKVSKAIFVVPGGFGNGPFLKSMKCLTFPLVKFLMTKSEKNLVSFMDAFYTKALPADIAFQKNVLPGVKVDYRRPTLIRDQDAKTFRSPVYAMVADDDIFFPGDITLQRSKEIFSGFKESYILKNTKHIPAQAQYPEISGIISKWLAE